MTTTIEAWRQLAAAVADLGEAIWRALADWCVPARALAWGKLTTSSGSHAAFRVKQHAGTVVWLHPDDQPEPTLAEVAAGEQLAHLIGAPRWRIRWRPGRQER